jgi:hypothetical protein
VQVVWRLCGDCVQVVCRLCGGCLQIVCRMCAGCVQVVCRLCAGCVQVVHQLWSVCLQVLGKLRCRLRFRLGAPRVQVMCIIYAVTEQECTGYAQAQFLACLA